MLQSAEQKVIKKSLTCCPTTAEGDVGALLASPPPKLSEEMSEARHACGCGGVSGANASSTSISSRMAEDSASDSDASGWPACRCCTEAH